MAGWWPAGGGKTVWLYPVEASEFYQDYKQGRYANVLKATAADVQVMGVEDDKNRPVQYLQLYKGLA